MDIQINLDKVEDNTHLMAVQTRNRDQKNVRSLSPDRIKGKGAKNSSKGFEIGTASVSRTSGVNLKATDIKSQSSNQTKMGKGKKGGKDQKNNNGFKKSIENVILGKLAPGEPRSMSGISIGHPNQIENLKARKYLVTEHPLTKEDTDSWNNIPTCVAKAIQNIINQFIDSEESLFDY